MSSVDLRWLAVLSLMVWIAGGCATPVTQPVEVSEDELQRERFKQRVLALETRLRRIRRLQDVSLPLKKAAVPFCEGQREQVVGVWAANLYTFSEDWRPAAEHLLGLDRGVRLIHVVEHSPAQRAGLQTGDELISVGGWAVPAAEPKTGERRIVPDLPDSSPPSKQRITSIQKVQETIRQLARKQDTVPMRIRRDRRTDTVVVHSETACSYSVQLLQGDEVNAMADGSAVAVTTGMMRFARKDSELAQVVAHELAHNVMDHVQKMTRNWVLGTILDIAAATQGVYTRGLFGTLAARTYSQAFESEADYVGLYLMARADLPYREAPRFWRRLAAEHAGSIEERGFLATHPASPERFQVLRKIVREINRKQKQEQPLLPEMQDDQSDSTPRVVGPDPHPPS